jgi:hypothetical protein
MNKLIKRIICYFRPHIWIYLYKSSSERAIEDRTCNRCHRNEYFGRLAKIWIEDK